MSIQLNSEARTSITLIGMPGVGKSTLGRRLAKLVNYDFLDTDVVIQKVSGMGLQEYVRQFGDDAFLKLEEQVVCDLAPSTTLVIAPGGSLVYSDLAISHLKTFSKIVYLKDTLQRISQRISNLETRGIVGLANKTLEMLFDERSVLYERYADFTFDISKQGSDAVVKDLERLCQQ